MEAGVSDITYIQEASIRRFAVAARLTKGATCLEKH